MPTGSKGLPSCKPRGSPWAWGRSHGVPSPAWMGFAAHGVPPLVALGTASPTSLWRIRTPHLHLHVLWVQGLQDCPMHLLEVRCLCLRTVITVAELTCSPRAGSRIPLAFSALSTICCLTAGDGPASLYASSKVRPRPSRFLGKRGRAALGCSSLPSRTLRVLPGTERGAHPQV